MTDSFGPFVSLAEIRNAPLALMQADAPDTGYPLILYYLAQAERLAGQPPHTYDQPLTFRGGLDFEVYLADELPAIVSVAAPTGAPERYDVGSYSQWFEMKLGAIVKGDKEEDALALADIYGVALTDMIAQHGGLGRSRVNEGSPFAIKTNLEEFPVVEFAVNAATSRNMLRTVVTFHTCVAPVLSETGPPAFPPDPYDPPEEPFIVRTTDVEFFGVETLPSE